MIHVVNATAIPTEAYTNGYIVYVGNKERAHLVHAHINLSVLCWEYYDETDNYDEVLNSYALWLTTKVFVERDIAVRNALRYLSMTIKDGTPVYLVCWCAPNPCTAEVIRDIISYGFCTKCCYTDMCELDYKFNLTADFCRVFKEV